MTPKTQTYGTRGIWTETRHRLILLSHGQEQYYTSVLCSVHVPIAARSQACLPVPREPAYSCLNVYSLIWWQNGHRSRMERYCVKQSGGNLCPFHSLRNREKLGFIGCLQSTSHVLGPTGIQLTLVMLHT